jgi:hypothetical protein
VACILIAPCLGNEFEPHAFRFEHMQDGKQLRQIP